MLGSEVVSDFPSPFPFEANPLGLPWFRDSVVYWLGAAEASSRLPQLRILGGKNWTHPRIPAPNSAPSLAQPSAIVSRPASTHKSGPIALQLTQHRAPWNPPFSRLQLKGPLLRSGSHPLAPGRAILLRLGRCGCRPRCVWMRAKRATPECAPLCPPLTLGFALQRQAEGPGPGGRGFLALRPEARRRHALGPAPRNPEVGARGGAAGAAGRSGAAGPAVGGRPGRDPARDLRRAVAKAQVSAGQSWVGARC